MHTVSRLGRALAPAALLFVPLLSRCFGGDVSNAGWSGPPFSAQLMDNRQHDRSPSRIYMGDQKLRLDVNDGGQAAFVFDPAHRTLLLINNKDKTYLDAGMLAPLAAAGIGPVMRFLRPVATGDPCTQWNTTVDQFAAYMTRHSEKTKPHFTCQDLGSESVNGRSAHKWSIASNEKKDEGTVWIDDRLHIMVKSLDKDGGMELRDIHEGPQAAALFEPPAGYRKLGLSEMLAAVKGAANTSSAAGSIADSGAKSTAADAMQKVKEAVGRP